MPERRPPGATPGAPVRAVAAHGLVGTTLAPPRGPLDDAAWSALLADAGRHRVLGLLAACVEDGGIEVTALQFDQVADAHRAAMTRILDIEAAAVDAVDLLGTAGADVRVLKGLAVAHLDMADPSQRDFGDADLLVEPGAFPRAIDVLLAAGLPRDLPERRRGFDGRFAKDATLFGRRGVEIDLHRTLAPGAFGLWLDPSAVWDAGEPFVIAGRPLRALTPEARLLHACYNAVLGDRVPRLAALRDVAQLAGREDLDAGTVVRLAEGARGGVVVARAMAAAGEALGVGPGWALWDWAGSRADWRWERRVLALYESQGGSNTTTLLSGLLGLATTGARLSYLSGLVFPCRAYVRARRRAGRPREWKRGLSELLGRPPAGRAPT